MRLFLAIDIKKEAKDYLAMLQSRISVPYAKLRLTSGYHLTLKFLGDCNEEETEKIKKILSKIRFKSFNYKIKGIGIFKRKGRINIVWVAVNPVEEIKKLQLEIEERLNELGFEKDNRFHPHITLARIKHINEKELFIENIKNIKKKAINSKANSFVLYQSTLTPQGPIYNVIERFKAEDL